MIPLDPFTDASSFVGMCFVRSSKATAFISVLLIFPCLAFSQEWESTLYPSDWVPAHEREDIDFLTDTFIQDFSYAGYHRGERPLPRISEGIVNVVDMGADPSGEQDSTEAIQTAIDQVRQNGGGVVYLPEGTFKVSRQAGRGYCLRIASSHTVMRGAGKDKTFIYNTSTQMRQAQVIQVQGSATSWMTGRSSHIPIVKDYFGPTKELELESSRFSRLLNEGDWIMVWNPATDAFFEEINMGPGSDGVSWLGDGVSLRGQRWLRQIVSKEETTLVLDAPTRWRINTRDQPVVYKASDYIMEVGLEDFSIGNIQHSGSDWGEGDYSTSGNSAYDVHDSWLICYRGVTNSWIRNVSSFGPDGQKVHVLSNGVLLSNCRGITLYRVSMTNVQYGGGGGNGYSIRFSEANESMAVECEVAYCRHGIVQWRMENSGNVFLRNYDHNTAFQWGSGSGTQTSGKGSDHHGLFSASNLFDSNRVDRSYFEAAYRGSWGNEHGMTASQVVYWNTEGMAYHPSAPYIIHTEQFGHGYVIGTSGQASAVRTTEKRPGSAERTNPVDFVEGVGEGEMLTPRSLYLDQFFKRNQALDTIVNYTVRRDGDKVKLEWQLPPALLAELESSNDIANWTSLIDISSETGVYEVEIPSKLFYRLSSRNE